MIVAVWAVPMLVSFREISRRPTQNEHGAELEHIWQRSPTALDSKNMTPREGLAIRASGLELWVFGLGVTCRV